MVSPATAKQEQVADSGFPIFGNLADRCAGESAELLWPLGTRQVAKRFWIVATRRQRNGVDSAPGAEANDHTNLERH